MICKNCGNQMDNNARFCTRCGNVAEVAEVPSIANGQPETSREGQEQKKKGGLQLP